MHILEDIYYPEIIDPASGEVLPDGATGELVLTHIWPTNDREAMAAEAAAAFGRPVTVAREYDTFEIAPASTDVRETRS